MLIGFNYPGCWLQDNRQDLSYSLNSLYKATRVSKQSVHQERPKVIICAEGNYKVKVAKNLRLIIVQLQ